MLAFRNNFAFCFAGILCIALIGVAGNAQAGALMDTANAFDDGNGPTSGAWKDSVSYSGGVGFSATLEYAVFGPGKFADFLSENSIAYADPTDPTHLVYAYQIEYLAGFGSISASTVALDGDETIGIVGNIPKGLVGADADPASGNNQGGTSIAWNFVDGSTALFTSPPKTSTILFFTSPQIPELDTASLFNIGGPAPQMVASPSNQFIPEPASLTLLLVGGASVLGLMRRRRTVG